MCVVESSVLVFPWRLKSVPIFLLELPIYRYFIALQAVVYTIVGENPDDVAGVPHARAL